MSLFGNIFGTQYSLEALRSLGDSNYYSYPVLRETCSCGASTEGYDPQELAVWRKDHKCKEDKHGND